MILGIGTDIIEISRVEKLLAQQKETGLKRIFTEKEIAYCSKKKKNAESYAGRFAAKEALFKATGIGWRDGLKWTDFEIINDELGKPQVNIYGKAKEIFKNCTINLSISHNKTQAIAFVVVEKEA
ncbi:MAG: holo-ACP synthase [Calditrichia bacterium]|nr:holo-ACP synthase [Calditrichia bacterium]